MKRAEGFVGGPRALEGKVATDDLHDVVCGGYLLNEFLGDSGHAVRSVTRESNQETEGVHCRKARGRERSGGWRGSLFWAVERGAGGRGRFWAGGVDEFERLV